MMHFPRRRFLQAAGLGAAGLAFSRVNLAQAAHPLPLIGQEAPGDMQQSGVDFWEPTLVSYNELYDTPPMLGRVQADRLSIFEAPSPQAARVRNVYKYYVAPIYRGVVGERYDQRWWSPLWYDIGEGYIHSGMVVPCMEVFHTPDPEIPAEGFFWGEVTAPMVTQWKKPNMNGGRWDWTYQIGFFGSTHKIVDYAKDESGMEWYRIEDDFDRSREAWMLAKTIRRMQPEEFEPISPDVTDKRIVLDLDRQMLLAYEGSTAVFQTRIASGTTSTNPDGQVIDFSTPFGTSDIQRKAPSRRMRGNESGVTWDVNGVPFCTYFSATGAAIHGAYWHNNYGLPKSKGCINVTPDAAKWVYRWSQPYRTYFDEYRFTESGEPTTPVEVVGTVRASDVESI